MHRIVVTAVAVDRNNIIADFIVAAGINVATFNGIVFVKFVASKAIKAETPLFVDVLQFRHVAKA